MRKKNNRSSFTRDGFFEDERGGRGQNRNTKKGPQGQQSSNDNQPLDNLNLKSIKPLTKGQERAFNIYRRDKKNLVMSGYAGTGKTFLASYLALESLMDRSSGIDKIIVIRSAVQSREMGFTTGDVKEKEEPYKQIYRPIFGDLMGRGDAFQILEKKHRIEFMSTSFLRGLTFDNAIIIFDEIQNCNFVEISTVISRIGENSRLIMSGDFRQTDLKKRNDESGFGEFVKIANRMNEFGMVDFQVDDIVRSGFVKAWFEAMGKS